VIPSGHGGHGGHGGLFVADRDEQQKKAAFHRFTATAFFELE